MSRVPLSCLGDHVNLSVPCFIFITKETRCYATRGPGVTPREPMKHNAM